MRVYPKDFRLLGLLALVLVAEFSYTGVAAYWQAREAIRQALVQQSMPLAGELIHTRIRAAALTEPPTILDPQVNTWLTIEAVDTQNAGPASQLHYFVDATGRMLAGGHAMRDTVGLQQIADRILNRDPAPRRLEYRQGQAPILVNSRYLPELDWYLIVERNLHDETSGAWRQLILSLIAGVAATLLMLALALWGATRYQRRFARMAASDPLTGLANQQSFAILLEQAVRDMQRSAQPLCLIQFEIDDLDAVMAREGHLSGEHVLYTVAQLTNTLVRSNDIVARWSSNTIIVLLRDCPLEVALRTDETLCCAVAEHPFGLASPIAIRTGVVACEPAETPSALLQRAEVAMRLAAPSQG